MLKSLRYWLLIVLALPALIATTAVDPKAVTATTPKTTTTAVAPKAITFIEGKEYLQLATPINNMGPKNGKATVVEFFNYGCPACYNFEPVLEAWLKVKPKNIDFVRLPIVFHDQWLVYAKTYYALHAMNLVDKLTPVLFEAIHKQNLDLSNEQAMTTFLSQHGVNISDFQSTYNFIPGVQADIARSDNAMREVLMNDYLMKKYKWMPQIPALLINGKYITGPGLTDNDGVKVTKIVEFLVNKEQQQPTKVTVKK